MTGYSASAVWFHLADADYVVEYIKEEGEVRLTQVKEGVHSVLAQMAVVPNEKGQVDIVFRLDRPAFVVNGVLFYTFPTQDSMN